MPSPKEDRPFFHRTEGGGKWSLQIDNVDDSNISFHRSNQGCCVVIKNIANEPTFRSFSL